MDMQAKYSKMPKPLRREFPRYRSVLALLVSLSKHLCKSSLGLDTARVQPQTQTRVQGTAMGLEDWHGNKLLRGRSR